MYEIYFYKDALGNEPVREHLDDLATKTDKASRITLNKILDYMKILSEHGTRAGEPYVKHIDGDIWELRLRSDRIFFFAWTGAQFILLHHYIKKSQKAPQREIDKAKRYMQDFIDRSDTNE